MVQQAGVVHKLPANLLMLSVCAASALNIIHIPSLLHVTNCAFKTIAALAW